MKKASEYRHHAQECLLLARRAQNDEQRVQLVRMAEIWQKLAAERERYLADHPEAAVPLEPGEPPRPGRPLAPAQIR